ATGGSAGTKSLIRPPFFTPLPAACFVLDSGTINKGNFSDSGARMVRCLRVCLAGALLVSFVAGSSLGTPPSAQQALTFTADSVGATITQYCVECHNDRLK